uniref:dihydropteroate synthase n=1 Tax=Bacillus paramobilis TaxID=2817477 RepID=UPI001C81821A
AKVSVDEEIKRVVSMIQAVSKEVKLPISIDTYTAEVAKQGIGPCAPIINDIWGLNAEPKIADVAANSEVPVILMHDRDYLNYRKLMADM